MVLDLEEQSPDPVLRKSQN
jgi:hypothetical protein